MNKDKVNKVNDEILTKLEYVGVKQPAIICDVDGTVALMMGQRKPFEYELAFDDQPNWPVIDAVFAVKAMLEHKLTSNGDFVSVHLIMLSARENKEIDGEPFESVHELTKMWLNKHMRGPIGEPHNRLFMREKGDFRKDCYVKYELYKDMIEPYYDIKYVFDDRNQVVDMWRNGCKLTCFQVADGNF